MIKQPKGPKQKALKTDDYVKLRVYSYDFFGWTLTVLAVQRGSQSSS